MDTGEQPQTAVNYVRRHSKHTGSIKAVLIMLADFIDDGNDCPSQKELAATAGVSVDTVRRCLGELAKDKTITIVKSGGKRVKGGQRDCYAINRAAATTTPDATGLQEPPRTQQHGSPMPAGTEQPGCNPEDAHTHAATGARAVVVSVSQEKDRQTDNEPVADKHQGGEPDDGLSADDCQLKGNFEGVFGGLTPLWWDELKGHIAYYSHVFVNVAISNGEKLRQKGEVIRDPMAYIRTALANMATKGLIPHLSASQTPSRSPAPYSPTCDLSKHSSAPTQVRIHPRQQPRPVDAPVEVNAAAFTALMRERQKAEKAKVYGA